MPEIGEPELAHRSEKKTTANVRVRRDSLKAATMARKMLWVDERTIPLAHFRDIGQK